MRAYLVWAVATAGNLFLLYRIVRNKAWQRLPVTAAGQMIGVAVSFAVDANYFSARYCDIWHLGDRIGVVVSIASAGELMLRSCRYCLTLAMLLWLDIVLVFAEYATADFISDRAANAIYSYRIWYEVALLFIVAYALGSDSFAKGEHHAQARVRTKAETASSPAAS